MQQSIPAQPNPIDEFEVGLVRYTVTAVHVPSQLDGTGTADTPAEATDKAKDDLLRKLEEMGGC